MQILFGKILNYSHREETNLILYFREIVSDTVQGRVYSWQFRGFVSVSDEKSNLLILFLDSLSPCMCLFCWFGAMVGVDTFQVWILLTKGESEKAEVKIITLLP
jgi:hypothetical protein